MALFVYTCLSYLVLPFGVAFHLLFVWRRAEFRRGFWQRYGWLPQKQELYGINTPDQVFMYIPIEPALFLALQEDKNIFMDAYDKRVVLVSNTTLLSTLRVVSELWQFDDQKRNVLEIAKQSGLLYDKFEGFVSDLIKVGNNINSSQSSYQDAMNKLSEGKGNLVSKVENLKKLGAKTKKNLPQKLLDRSTN